MANTTNYALTKPTVGGDADVWGGYLNTNWDDADALFSAKATTGSANAYVLTTGLSLSAYATGQKFTIIPNFTNSGAATINVDAIGAKNLYRLTGGSLAAVSSGDVVSGVPTDIVYDGTQFVVVPRYEAQPLDATLTALAALSWSSGNPVVQFTAADTVSLTLTPALTSMTLGGSAVLTAATGLALTGGTLTGDVTISKGSASYYLNNTDAGADAGLWRLGTSATTFFGQTRTDANGTGATWLTVTRSGTTVTDVTLAPTLTIGSGSNTKVVYASNYFAWQNGNDCRIYFDTSGGNDFLEYERSNNRYRFYIGGTEYVRLDAGGVKSAYHLPFADNVGTVGAIALRFTDIFAVSGSVNTSDAREKTPLEETPEALRRIVRRIFQRCGLYRWKFKGDDAPWSYGVTAQIVEEEFAAEGLDAHDYHLFEEGDLPGNEDQPTRKCLRPDQLFYLGISTLMLET